MTDTQVDTRGSSRAAGPEPEAGASLPLLDLVASSGFGLGVVGLAALLLGIGASVPQEALARDASGWAFGDLALARNVGLARIAEGILAWLVPAGALLHVLARIVARQPPVAPLRAASSGKEPFEKAVARAVEAARKAGLSVRTVRRDEPGRARALIEAGLGREAVAALALAAVGAAMIIATQAIGAPRFVLELPVDGAADVTRPQVSPVPEPKLGPSEVEGGCRSEGSGLRCALKLDGRDVRWFVAPGLPDEQGAMVATWIATAPAPVTGLYELDFRPSGAPAERTAVHAEIGAAFALPGGRATLWTFASGLGPALLRTGDHLSVGGSPALVQPGGVASATSRATVPRQARVEVAAPLPVPLLLIVAALLAVACALRLVAPGLRVEIVSADGAIEARVAALTASSRLAAAADLARRAIGAEGNDAVHEPASGEVAP